MLACELVFNSGRVGDHVAVFVKQRELEAGVSHQDADHDVSGLEAVVFRHSLPSLQPSGVLFWSAASEGHSPRAAIAILQSDHPLELLEVLLHEQRGHMLITENHQKFSSLWPSAAPWRPLWWGRRWCRCTQSPPSQASTSASTHQGIHISLVLKSTSWTRTLKNESSGQRQQWSCLSNSSYQTVWIRVSRLLVHILLIRLQTVHILLMIT